MGQPITVVPKSSSRPGVLRFEINRSLTGMGHERYASRADAIGKRPVDELARRLFDHGGIRAVHVNSSVITVDLAGGSTGAGLADLIADLFRFYDPDAAPEGSDTATEVPE
jgi:hypothetical protein